jgi:hypothetical protein
VRQLKKAEVESMLDSYDQDPVTALTTALSLTLEVDEATWDELAQLAGVTESQREALLAHETAALDELLKLLVEKRSL